MIKTEDDLLRDSINHVKYLTNKFNSLIRDSSIPGIECKEFKEFLTGLEERNESSQTLVDLFWRTKQWCDTKAHLEFDEEELYYLYGKYLYDFSKQNRIEKKLSKQLSKLYIDWLNQMIENIIVEKFTKFWYLIFIAVPIERVEDVLKLREDHGHQRTVCTDYYFLATNFNDNFYEETIEFSDNSPWQRITSIETSFGILGYCDFDKSKLLIQRKISDFFQKFTVFGGRKKFMYEFHRATEVKDLNEHIQLFIDNNFHFNGEIWTSKIRPHELPNIMASRFIRFLVMMSESNSVEGATLEDLKRWLLYEYYGVKGFNYDNYKKHRRKTILEMGRRKKREQQEILEIAKRNKWCKRGSLEWQVLKKWSS